MNCRKCGRELRVGVKRCPYCGTVVPAPGSRTGSGFNWDLTDRSESLSPEPTVKKPDVTFDWNTEKPTNDNRMNAAFQSENRWKEPEEAKQLFSFDATHEKLQKQVDQKVDDIAAEKPAPAIDREPRDDLFVLPSDMTMDDFSDLLGESIVQESDSVLVVNRRDPQNEIPSLREIPPVHTLAEQEEAESDLPVQERELSESAPPEINVAPEIPVRTEQPVPLTVVAPPLEERPEKERKERSPEDQAYDPFIGQELLRVPEIPAFLMKSKPESQQPLLFAENPETTETVPAGFDLGTIRSFMGSVSPDEVQEGRGPSLASIDPGYTPEEEKRAIENFQNLINAEEDFSKSVNQFTFMSEEESEKADQAWNRREEVSNEPKISFASLEEEYQKFKDTGEIPPLSLDEEDDSEKKEDSLSDSGTALEEPEVVDTAVIGETDEEQESNEDDIDGPSGRVRKAVDLVRKTAGKAAAVAEESVRSLVSEDDEDEEDLDRGVFLGLSPSIGMVDPEKTSADEKKKPRELNIRINEPTGTQVKVRTEEVALSEQAVNLRDTQEVDLGMLKEGPKSVKVQVEVNHSSSSSSVEVTRSNDGSTVVKTVEEGTGKEHLYNASGEDLLLQVPDNKTFWANNEMPATKMTITEIFSPEMQEFKNQWEAEEEQRRAEGLETVVRAPDRSPEAMQEFLSFEMETEEPTDADAESAVEAETLEALPKEPAVEESETTGETEAVEEKEEKPDEEPLSEDEQPDQEDTEESEIQPKDEILPETTSDDPGTEESVEPESPDEQKPDEITESPENSEPVVEEQLEPPEEEPIPDTVTEDVAVDQEKNPVTVNEEGHFKRAGKIHFHYKKSEAQPELNPASGDEETTAVLQGSTDPAAEKELKEGSETEELQGLFNSLTNIKNRIAEAISSGEDNAKQDERSVEPEADMDSEVEEDQADTAEKKKAKTKEDNKWSAAFVMRIIIYVLIVAILIEFAVIGIKLFAPNSQGAVLINRIEQTIAGEDILSTISVDSYLPEAENAEVPDLDQS